MASASIAIGRPKRAGARRPRSWDRRQHLPARLSVEPLEVRSLLSASAPADSLPAYAPNETIDLAWDLGTPSQPATTVGSVGTGPDGAADVTWYHFQLGDAARVDLTVRPPAGRSPFASVLSLFNNDPPDGNDPYNIDGHRLLAQVQADPTDGIATFDQELGPGDYYVAISGGGNTQFSPFLAGSGFQGTMGVYELTVGATDLGLSADGPTMLWSDPAAGAVLDASPLAIRVEMSGPIANDNGMIDPSTVQLLAVSGGVETPITLASVSFSTTANELRLFPLAPLAPGQYVVQLSGDSGQDPTWLTNPDGTIPLGEDAQHPLGADESFGFTVAGIDGVAGATASDNTAATARDLGNLVGAGIAQAAGAIGVDPAFNPGLATDPTNPANQVDLYHFQISGPGRYTVLAEVFAGRIGSPLAPGLSLFERDPSDGRLVFIAGDIDSFNAAKGTDWSTPLYLDSSLDVALTAGDYYLAVADGSNTASPNEGHAPGGPGIFDPNQPDSAQLGWSTGAYVLNVMARPAPPPAEVVASSPSPNQVLDQAPTRISVRFSKPVNLQLLAFQTAQVTYGPALPQVFIEGADGTRYNVHLVGYDPATNTATFQMLDGLPNGQYALHLSGPAGLSDSGGNPLPGNDPSGDEVIPFTVQGPDRGVAGDMTDGYTIASNAAQGVPQDIGVLFPDELQAGVTIVRGPESAADPGSSATSDTYVIRLLQYQNYTFQLSGSDGIQLSVTDASGDPVQLNTPDGLLYGGLLNAGTYTLSVGWPADSASSDSYQLLIRLNGQQDNAPPLIDNPAPALQISLAPSGTVPGTSVDGSFGSGGAGAVGSITAGPIAGVTSGAGPGAVAPVAGVAGPTGAVGGAGGSSSTTVALASNLAQTEAAGGLSGLALGPLGGSGGQVAGLTSPTIQVALTVPSTAAPGSNALAVSLVTLTQVFSSNHEGEDEGIEPVESADPPGTAATEPPVPSGEGSGDAECGGPVGPRGDSAAALVSLATVRGPAPGPVALADPPVTAVPAGPMATEAAPVSKAATPANVGPAASGPAPVTAEGDDAQLGPAMRLAQWAIAAATLAAVYRGHSAFRGLGWKKRVIRVGVRSDGPTAPKPMHDGTLIPHPSAVAITVHALRLRPRLRP